ncbi:hypothetical protein LC612_28445 [Nostoc sp. CHAB 5834]|nr:hypothetical protein [Nostoc sp. CHAB 5834]
MNALQLLDDHLIKIGRKLYPKSRIDRIYEKLNAPKSDVFYEGNRVKSYIDPDGEVTVATRYPDVSDKFSVTTPEQNGYGVSNLPPPYKEMGQMFKEFKKFTAENPGLYYSRPVSYEGAKISHKMGFKGNISEGKLYRDTRRFQNMPAINELVGYKDMETQRIPSEEFVAISNARKTPGYLRGVCERILPIRKYTLQDSEVIRNGGAFDSYGNLITREGNSANPGGYVISSDGEKYWPSRASQPAYNLYNSYEDEIPF